MNNCIIKINRLDNGYVVLGVCKNLSIICSTDSEVLDKVKEILNEKGPEIVRPIEENP